MTISAFWQLYDFKIPLILKGTFGIGDTLTGFVMSLDNIVALFLIPVFGALSDKTHTKLGAECLISFSVPLLQSYL